MRSFAAVLCLLAVANAHMWLRSPLSRGGVDNIGGTTGPCNNLAAGSGTRTTYKTGQSATIQFRVNQHGPDPFKISFASSGNTFTTVLKDNIANTVTAGPDGFNGVNVQVTIPNTPCTACSIQLSGMGNNGASTWYNCADIEIVDDATLPQVASLNPASGATAGGTDVTVTGTNFGGKSSGDIKCVFDITEVTGTWISSTQVSCKSPAHNLPATVPVEVTIDGTRFTTNGVTFEYTGKEILPTITWYDPIAAPSGTEITFIGDNYLANSVRCKFGDSVVVGAWVDKTTLTCVVPARADPAVYDYPVTVSIDGGEFSGDATFTYAADITHNPDSPPEGGAASSIVPAALMALVTMVVMMMF